MPAVPREEVLSATRRHLIRACLGLLASTILVAVSGASPGANASSSTSAGPPADTTQGQIPLPIGDPSISSIQVRVPNGSTVTRLVPEQNYWVEVRIDDPDDLGDVSSVEITLYHKTLTNDPNLPAQEARYAWIRQLSPSFVHIYPNPSTWQLIENDCDVSMGILLAPHVVRFAIVPGKVARASSSGEWRIRARLHRVSNQPPISATASGFSMAEHVELIPLAPGAFFAPGPPTAQDLPLSSPASGVLGIAMFSNFPFDLQAMGTELTGTQIPGSSIPEDAMAWSIQGGGSGTIKNSFDDLVEDLPANSTESPQLVDLGLTIDHPDLPPQTYSGSLTFRMNALSGGFVSDQSIPTLATVVTTNLAAQSGVGELHPASVAAGAPSQGFTAWLRSVYQPQNTGINAVRIGIPAGYGTPIVSAVRIASAPVPFTDFSVLGTAEVRLKTTLTSSSLIEIDLRTDVPSAADSIGSAFPIQFDDTTTMAVPPQSTTPGDANGLADGDHWIVTVNPGPPASITVSPGTVQLFVDDQVNFSASILDAHGNSLYPAITWRVEGAMGVIDGTGHFTATQAGNGRVIAEAAGLADTVPVAVAPIPNSIIVRGEQQQFRAVLPGDSSHELFRFLVVNPTSKPETLVSLRVDNRSFGPGNQAQMDASFGRLSLLIAQFELAGSLRPDIVGPSAFFVGGAATFTGFAVVVGAADSVSLSVRGGASVTARDGDFLDFVITGPGSVVFSRPVPVTGDWEIDPEGGFLVDGMSAAQVELKPVSTSTFGVGSTRNVALHLTLPPNGYQADQLRRLDVMNLGTAQAGVDIGNVEAWADDGDGDLDPARDLPLGVLQFTGDRWERTGLSLPIPVGGRPILYSVDIASSAFEGRTIRLALPGPPDPGAGMQSGNTGPLDKEVANPLEQAISNVDRIAVAGIPIDSAGVNPGAAGVPLLALVATNTYSVEHHLVGLTVSNASTGSGSQADLDAEVDRLVLRLDADGDGVLGDFAVDPPLATATFTAGRATFTGFNWTISEGTTGVLFVTADVSLHGAANGDLLSAEIAQSIDLVFEDPATVAGSWPVSSGAEWQVDGMLAAQIVDHGAPGFTLGPGDGPLPVLDLTVPRNGYAADVLNSFRVMNLGTAGTSEIAELRLWRDGGDGTFQGGGDDQDLGPLTLFAGAWQSQFLSEPLSAPGARLFVALTANSTLTDSTTVQLEVPLLGIVTASGNTGPLDVPVTNLETQLLSSSPLLAKIEILPASSTPGQPLSVEMTVRNVGGERVNGVTPTVLAGSGTGSASYVSGPSPASWDVDPGDERVFTWSYAADSIGTVRLSGSAGGTGAVSGLPRRSLDVISDLHQVFTEAESLSLFATSFLPSTVTRGQTGVLAWSMTFTHPGDPGAADIWLRGFVVRLQTQAGGPIVPADLLSRVVVREAANIYLDRDSLETAGSTVDLTLTTPVRIATGSPVTLSLRLDVSSTTGVPDFRLILDDGASFQADDAVSGAPAVVFLENQTYPLQTGLARVVESAVELQISPVPGPERRTGLGQDAVPLGRLKLENPGVAGLSSDVRLSSLAITIQDSLGNPSADLRDYLERIRVRGPGALHADLALSAGGAVLVVPFSPALLIPADVPIHLDLEADLAVDVPPGIFRLALGDSSLVDARDASSGTPVPVRYPTQPVLGDTVRVELTAEQLAVRGTPLLPPSVGVGQGGLNALRAVLRHPGGPSIARIRLDSLVVRILDETRLPLPPATYVDRLVVQWNGVDRATVFNPPATGGLIPVGLPDLLIDPGQSDTLTLVLDLESSAPGGYLELTVEAEDLFVADANLGTPIAVLPDTGFLLPMSSGLTHLEPPATTMAVGLTSLMPAALPPDGTEFPVARISLRNSAPAGSSPIRVDGLRLIASSGDGGPFALGAAADRLVAYIDGVPWATSATLTPDSSAASLAAASPVSIPPGPPIEVEVRMVPRTPAPIASLRVGLEDRGVGVVQPQGVTVAVLPEPGTQFTMWTEVGSFGSTSLSGSYANFPNPFAAGREPTTFVYFLPQPARVTLRIFSARGHAVVTLLDRASMPAGLQQSDRWDGRNGAGSIVTNGVYFAELVAELDDGTRERVLRKVAVLR